MIYSTAIAFGSPLRLSIDFTGGSLLELSLSSSPWRPRMCGRFYHAGSTDTTVQTIGSDENVVIRAKRWSVEAKEALAR
jgi:preprotein translocase subunit SecF